MKLITKTIMFLAMEYRYAEVLAKVENRDLFLDFKENIPHSILQPLHTPINISRKFLPSARGFVQLSYYVDFAQ